VTNCTFTFSLRRVYSRPPRRRSGNPVGDEPAQLLDEQLPSEPRSNSPGVIGGRASSASLVLRLADELAVQLESGIGQDPLSGSVVRDGHAEPPASPPSPAR